MFKQNWEKKNPTQIARDALDQMIFHAGIKTTIQPISGGCANLNYKIYGPFILRVYLCDKTAAFREQKIAELLKDQIPVPLIHYIGEVHDLTFSVAQFMPGMTLRDLLLSKRRFNMGELMHCVGASLARISSHHFDKSGFFDKNLNVVKEIPDDFAIKLARECLNDINFIDAQKIVAIFEKNGWWLSSD